MQDRGPVLHVMGDQSTTLELSGNKELLVRKPEGAGKCVGVKQLRKVGRVGANFNS